MSHARVANLDTLVLNVALDDGGAPSRDHHYLEGDQSMTTATPVIFSNSLISSQ